MYLENKLLLTYDFAPTQKQVQKKIDFVVVFYY